MPKVMVDEEILVAAFEALEGELHTPSENSECAACHVMWRIERALGRQITDHREGSDIESIESGGQRIVFK